MDRRTLVALLLMALVIVVVPRFFPSSHPPRLNPADSAAAAANPGVAAKSSPASPSPNAPANAAAAAANLAAPATSRIAGPAAPRLAAPESTTLAGQRTSMTLVNPGATPDAVRLEDYLNLMPRHRETMVVRSHDRSPLLHYRLVHGRDTIALDTVRFTVQSNAPATTTFVSTSPNITISYHSEGNGYRTSVRGSIGDASPGAALIIDLPRNFQTSEADTVDDQRHFAYAYKVPLREVTSIPFTKLDTVVRADTGMFQWVSARDKYWIVALMKPVTGANQGAGSGIFRGLTMLGDTVGGRVRRNAAATTVLPVNNGQFAFDLYIGPQAWTPLHALGNDLENVNQYASFLHPVVQPFVTIVMRVLLWMRSTTKLTYGWVLVVFGVVIRLLMWPLNQKAMRTSIQMQRIQPEMAEVQRKYKNDPEKQREAMMKLYQEHGMNPLSPILGCFPMLLPLPVLYALYFVFQNTIEFRGVGFLWLPDISLKDPYYITPLVMGVSMFALSWIGMRSAPPNPQTKMMSYMMPVTFTLLFVNLASGLNLYYAVQNLAALPQQWVVSRQRARAGLGSPSPVKSGGAKSSATSTKRSG